MTRGRRFLLELAHGPHGIRVLFPCRSLDCTAQLSVKDELELPHVRIEALADAQVEAFLHAYRPAQAAALWGTPQLDLIRSPC